MGVVLCQILEEKAGEGIYMLNEFLICDALILKIIKGLQY